VYLIYNRNFHVSDFNLGGGELLRSDLGFVNIGYQLDYWMAGFLGLSMFYITGD
jgi:hypothetical protein